MLGRALLIKQDTVRGIKELEKVNPSVLNL